MYLYKSERLNSTQPFGAKNNCWHSLHNFKPSRLSTTSCVYIYIYVRIDIFKECLYVCAADILNRRSNNSLHLCLVTSVPWQHKTTTPPYIYNIWTYVYPCKCLWYFWYAKTAKCLMFSLHFEDVDVDGNKGHHMLGVTAKKVCMVTSVTVG